jgi:hypothetical protein
VTLADVTKGVIVNRHRCPHCGKDGISALRKICLGPAWPTRCTECGGGVGVPYWSMVTIVPLVVALVLTPLVWGHPVYTFWLGALGTMGVFVLAESFVPLIKR